jgi:hypothetical protein
LGSKAGTMSRGRFLAALLLSAGVYAEPLGSCAQAADAVTVQSDQFSRDVTIIGPEDYENPLAGTYKDWRLRSWVDKQTHAVRNQLYVEFRYFGGWRFYEAAANDSAEQLETVTIDRHVEDCTGICSFSEIIGVTLSIESLRAHVASGLPIKISARDGDARIITITPGQIQAQLAAIDRIARQPASNSSGAPPPRVSLGVYFAPLDAKGLTALHIPSDHGLMVFKVMENSPAARAGIQNADVILSFDGIPVATVADLVSAAQSQAPGTKATMHIWRGGQEVDVPVRF